MTKVPLKTDKAFPNLSPSEPSLAFKRCSSVQVLPDNPKTYTAPESVPFVVQSPEAPTYILSSFIETDSPNLLLARVYMRPLGVS